jgi:diadenylate cyclase
MCDEIALAVKTLAKNQTGALIVVERDIGLKSYVESGIAVNGLLSYDLLVTVFNPKEPMHDGAVIIQNGRIAAAACFLPLTVKPRLSKELGTRHRAAIGITEETDAIAVVVSEETGSIAFAIDGEIERFLDFETLVVRLRDAIERRQPRKSVRSLPATVQHVDS